MALTNASLQNQKTRDELGSEPSIQPVVKVKSEDIIIPTLSIKTSSKTEGHAWIVGSSTNGIVGANTNTQDGQQQVVGGAGRVTTVIRIINDDDTHFELFNTTTYKDTGSTTAVWSTLGTAEVGVNTELQSLTVWKDKGTCVSATMYVTVDSGTTNISEFLSARGTTIPFESVTDGTEHEFTSTGNDLRWKITSAGSAVISRVKIKYNIIQS